MFRGELVSSRTKRDPFGVQMWFQLGHRVVNCVVISILVFSFIPLLNDIKQHKFSSYEVIYSGTPFFSVLRMTESSKTPGPPQPPYLSLIITNIITVLLYNILFV